MTTTTYKGYRIKTVGLSQYIYRPDSLDTNRSDGYAQSMKEAKAWVNKDLASVQAT